MIPLDVTIKVYAGVGIFLETEKLGVISSLVPAGPADVAGLQPGDRIDEVGGKRFTSNTEAVRALIGPPNSEVAVGFWRDEKLSIVTLKRQTFLMLSMHNHQITYKPHPDDKDLRKLIAFAQDIIEDEVLQAVLPREEYNKAFQQKMKAYHNKLLAEAAELENQTFVDGAATITKKL